MPISWSEKMAQKKEATEQSSDTSTQVTMTPTLATSPAIDPIPICHLNFMQDNAYWNIKEDFNNLKALYKSYWDSNAYQLQKTRLESLKYKKHKALSLPMPELTIMENKHFKEKVNTPFFLSVMIDGYLVFDFGKCMKVMKCKHSTQDEDFEMIALLLDLKKLYRKSLSLQNEKKKQFMALKPEPFSVVIDGGSTPYQLCLFLISEGYFLKFTIKAQRFYFIIYDVVFR